MLCRNLVLASLIPFTYFLNYRFHGLRFGWTNSVESRIRWRWLFVCIGLSIASMIATVIAGALLMPVEKFDTKPNGSPPPDAIQYALVIFFLKPLQSAGEEFVFRGYVTQAFSGLISKRWRWMGILIPAILFVIAHGFDQDFRMVFGRFAFGLGTGILVIWTGGLEAGIAMHVVTNVLIYAVAVMTDSIDQIRKTGRAQEGQWWIIILSNILEWTIYVGLTLHLAPRHSLQTKVWKAEVKGEILLPQ